MASPSRSLSLSSEAQPATSSITVDSKFSDKTDKGVSLPPHDALGKFKRKEPGSDVDSLSSDRSKSTKGKGPGKPKSSRPKQEFNFDKKI